MDQSNAVIGVLAICSNPGQVSALTRILRHTSWTLETASCLSSAESALRLVSPQVVLCDEKLLDGGWRDVLQLAHALDPAPEVVVISPSADDRLWGEALQEGVWDVLMDLQSQRDVVRTIHLAWQHWMDNARRKSVATTSPRKPAGSRVPPIAISATGN